MSAPWMVSTVYLLVGLCWGVTVDRLSPKVASAFVLLACGIVAGVLFWSLTHQGAP